MPLSVKLNLAIALAITVVLGTYGYIRVQREVRMFADDMQRDHEELARALALAGTLVADDDGPRGVAAFIAAADALEEHIAISWRPDPPGSGQVAAPGTMSAPVTEVVEGSAGEFGWRVTKIGVAGYGVTGQIVLRESLEAEQQYVRTTVKRVSTVLVAVLLVCIAITVSFGWVFVGRPLQRVMAKVRRAGEGDLRGPLELSQRDEMRELAEEINRMCERIGSANERAEHAAREQISALEQLRHAERLSTVGKLASGIAHEIGTPLNVVTARAKMIARGESVGAEVQEDAQVIADQSERIAQIIRQVLDFARGRKPQKRSEDLVRIARSTGELLTAIAQARGVTFAITSHGADVTAQVDGGQIQQVLINLLTNAMDALPDGGQVTVSIDATHDQQVAVRVTDSGVGMAPDVAARVFEPFFTTKDVGRGTGLGLSVAHGIVQEHGGTIAVTSELGTGSTFTITLPRGG